MNEFLEIQTYGWIFNSILIFILLLIFFILWRFGAKKFLLLICFIPFDLLAVYFMTEKLETRIDEAGIHYKVFPAHLTEKFIGWDQIKSIGVRDHIMYSGHTNAYDVYSINDKYGLYIFLRSGKQIILGTQKPDEINIYVNQLITKGILKH